MTWLWWTLTLARAQDSQSLDALLDSIPEIQSSPTEALPQESDTDPLRSGPSAEVTAYSQLVRDTLVAAWHPKTKLVLARPDALTRVLVQVDDSGRIVAATIVETSRDPSFDKGVFKAIQALGSVAAPPASAAGLAAKGIVVDFAADAKLR